MLPVHASALGGAGDLRPIVVRPFHRVLVVRVDAEVEDVFLRNPHVLEQLPWGMLEANRDGATLVGRDSVHSFIESNVRFFPVEGTRQVIAESVSRFGQLAANLAWNGPRPINPDAGRALKD